VLQKREQASPCARLLHWIVWVQDKITPDPAEVFLSRSSAHLGQGFLFSKAFLERMQDRLLLT
jgi:hypothetical protein